MVLAQAGDVNHVIDARLVGAFIAATMVGFIPLVKWLGGLAVASAFSKVTGLEQTVAQISAQAEQNRARHDDHGRKLALTTATAEHAYNKAAQAAARVDALNIKAAEMSKDIERVDEKAEEAFRKAVEVEGGTHRLALEHGKLEGRVDRVEEDVESVRTNTGDLADALNAFALKVAKGE